MRSDSNPRLTAIWPREQ